MATKQKPKPTEASLQSAMSLAWADHQHTRWQTWEALKLEAILAVGLVTLRFVPNGSEPSLTILGSALLFLLALSGVMISFHHRSVEITKFRQITDCETALHLDSVLGTFKPPANLEWWHPFAIWKSNTVLYIVRMHIAIAAFAGGLLLSRLFMS
jgi:hypothetical protein